MILLLMSLYSLAVLDGAFSGICAASGRNALIRKRKYYLRAMGFGSLCNTVVSVAGLLIIVISFVFMSATTRSQLLIELGEAGTRIAIILGFYAGFVLAFFALRAIPSVDIRSATSIVAFGPLSLFRPVVILFAIGYGVAYVSTGSGLMIVLLVGTIMLTARRLVDHSWQNRLAISLQSSSER